MVPSANDVPILLNCEVDGENKRINMNMVINALQATMICGDIGTTDRPPDAFEGWYIQVTTPYSNGQPVALCDLFN